MFSDTTPKYRRELEAASPRSTEETSRQCLERVRSRSCFGALRVAIWFVVLPGYLLAAGLVLAGVGAGGMAAVLHNAHAASFVSGALLYFVTAIITFVLTLAAHQALRLSADAVDLLIEIARVK